MRIVLVVTGIWAFTALSAAASAKATEPTGLPTSAPAPQRTATLNPSPSNWAFGNNTTVYKYPAPPVQAAASNNPSRSTPVNPSPSNWAFGDNATVYRHPAGPTPTSASNAPSKSTPINPSPSNWAFGNNTAVFKHPAPPSPTPQPRHCHGPSCRVRPAHWEWRWQAVWIPGYWRQQYYPARYEYRMVNGLAIAQLVQADRYENTFVPGYYEWRPVKIWVRPSWSCGL